MMKNFIAKTVSNSKVLLTGLALALAGVAEAATTGSCPEAAPTITVGTTEVSGTVTLTAKYITLTQQYTQYATYYYRVDLTKGNGYTFYLDNMPDTLVSFSVMAIATPGESSVTTRFTMSQSEGRKTAVVNPGDWASTDPSTCTFYINIGASKLSPGDVAGTLHLKQGVDDPTGSKTNPYSLAFSSGSFQTNSYALVSQEAYFKAELLAGARYRLETASGTAASEHALTVFSGLQAGDLKEDIVAPAGNNGFELVSANGGSYVFRVAASDSMCKLAYGQYAARTPEEHNPTALEVGKRTTCKPGYRTDPALAKYLDKVIDQQLFKFSAGQGSIVELKTEGASEQVPLQAEIYDSTGRVLASNDLWTAVSPDLALRFLPPADGTYYIGICEDLAAAGSSVPSGQTFSLEMFTDQWDPADDSRLGATVVVPGAAQQQTPSHRLWYSEEPGMVDSADWFRFEAKAGYRYDFTFAEREGNPALSLCDSAGQVLVSNQLTRLSYSAAAAGTYYVAVTQGNAMLPVDGAYALAYRTFEVGTVSLVTESTSVHETDETVSFTLRRTANGGNIRLRWGTVADTAQAGVNYFADGGEVVFEDGGALEQTVSVRLLASAWGWQGEKSFFVRLSPVTMGLDEDEGEYPAVLTGSDIFKVTIIGDGYVEPPVSPEVKDAEDVESPGTALTLGTFKGVLREMDGFYGPESLDNLARVEISSGSEGLMATVAIGEMEYDFSGTYLSAGRAELYADTEIGGVVYRSVLTLVTPTGTAASLSEALPAAPEVTLKFVRVDESGIWGDVVHFQGQVFRMDNAKHAAVRAQVAPYVGRYTLALADADGIVVGNGYLQLDVGVDGTVAIGGMTPEGELLVAGSTFVAAVAEDGGLALKVPIYYCTSDLLLGGTVTLVVEDEVAVARCRLEDRLFWNRSAMPELEAYGGEYDTVSHLGGLMALYDLTAFVGSDEVRVEDVYLSDAAIKSDNAQVDLRLERATGRLTGTCGGEATTAVVILTGSSESRLSGLTAAGPTLSVYASPTSRDNSEDWGFPTTVAFGGNGATAGIPAAIGAQSGDWISLPTPDPTQFVRAGFAFVGWQTPFGIVAGGGEYRVPATNVLLSAAWTYAELEECLKGPGLESLEFNIGTEGYWYATVEAGEQALRSAAIDKGSSSTLKVTVKAAGTVSFSWKCHTDEAGYAGCRFAVNGVEKASIADVKQAWEESAEFSVQAGDVLTWTFWRGGSAYDVSPDCAWLRRLSFGKKSTVTFWAEGGEPKSVWTTSVTGYAGQECLGDYLSEMPRAVWNTEMVKEWKSPTGGVVNLDWVFPDSDAVLVPLEVVTRRFFITYEANGGAGQVPVDDPQGHQNHDVVAVASGDTLYRTDGYIFVGWKIGDKVYDPADEATRYYTFGAADVTAVAQWEIDYATVLGCRGANLKFLNVAEYPWLAVSNNVDCFSCGEDDERNVMMMQSGGIKESQDSKFTVVAGEKGTISFSWRISSDDDITYAYGAYCLNDTEKARISQSDASGTGWRRVTLALEDGDRLTWAFVKTSGAYSYPDERAHEDRVCLKEVVWVPAPKPTYDFTISWSGAGVVGAVYSIDSQSSQTAVNGATIAVPNGSVIAVSGLANTNDWYHIVSGEGSFSQAGATQLVAERWQGDALPQDVTAADLGLSTEPGAPFADADASELAKLVSWATDFEKRVSDADSMRFSAGSTGDPQNLMAKAYLLDCVDTEFAVRLAKAAFQITDFKLVDGEGQVSPQDGSAYANGWVEVRRSDRPDGEYEKSAEESRRFFRIFLVK